MTESIEDRLRLHRLRAQASEVLDAVSSGDYSAAARSEISPIVQAITKVLFGGLNQYPDATHAWLIETQARLDSLAQSTGIQCDRSLERLEHLLMGRTPPPDLPEGSPSLAPFEKLLETRGRTRARLRELMASPKPGDPSWEAALSQVFQELMSEQ